MQSAFNHKSIYEVIVYCTVLDIYCMVSIVYNLVICFTVCEVQNHLIFYKINHTGEEVDLVPLDAEEVVHHL